MRRLAVIVGLFFASVCGAPPDQCQTASADVGETLPSPVADTEDVELMALYRQGLSGETGAMNSLFRELDRRVRAHVAARSHGLNHAQKEDLAQDMLLGVWKALTEGRGPRDHFLGWFYVVAHHRMIESLRKSNKPWRRFTTGLDMGQEIDRRIASDTGDTMLDTERLTQVIAGLRDAQRQVVQLRLEGVDFPEIARRTGRSEAALRQLYWRATENIRQRMEESGG